MNSEKKQVRSLQEMEMEVEAEGREWMRKRLQEKMQEEANRHGGVFPPERSQSPSSSTGENADSDGLRGSGARGMARKKSG